MSIVIYPCYFGDDTGMYWYVQPNAVAGDPIYMPRGGGIGDVAKSINMLEDSGYTITSITDDTLVYTYRETTYTCTRDSTYDLSEIIKELSKPYLLKRKSTAYYKNVETTTIVTKTWRCYTHYETGMISGTFYYYVAPDAVAGDYVYVYDDDYDFGGIAATDVSQLTPSGFVKIVSVIDDTLTINNGAENFTSSRNTAYDLTETATTTTAEVVEVDRGATFRVIGTPIIENDIVSGFSADSYLELPKTLSLRATDTFEIWLKVNSASTMGTLFKVGSASTENTEIGIYINSGGGIYLKTSDSSGTLITSLNFATAMEIQNKDVIIHCVLSNGTWVCSALNPDTKEALITRTSKTGISDFTERRVVIGSGVEFKSKPYFIGSVYLSECYIKKNNEIWWQPVEGGSDYDFAESEVKTYLLKGSGLGIISAVDKFESSTAGTYSIALAAGDYEITLVGAGGSGGGGTKHSNGASGGSGAFITAYVTLEPGTYSVVVGAGGGATAWMQMSGANGGASSIGDLLIAGGGATGVTDSNGGAGGTVTINTITNGSASAPGGSGSGGYGWGNTSNTASVYNGYGYGGAGGVAGMTGGSVGGNGYAKITMVEHNGIVQTPYILRRK